MTPRRASQSTRLPARLLLARPRAARCAVHRHGSLPFSSQRRHEEPPRGSRRRPGGPRLRPSAAHVKRNLRGGGWLGGPLRNRPRHADLVDILERAAVAKISGAAAADRDQRACRQIRRSDARKRICVPRTARYQRQPRLARALGLIHDFTIQLTPADLLDAGGWLLVELDPAGGVTPSAFAASAAFWLAAL